MENTRTAHGAVVSGQQLAPDGGCGKGRLVNDASTLDIDHRDSPLAAHGRVTAPEPLSEI